MHVTVGSDPRSTLGLAAVAATLLLGAVLLLSAVPTGVLAAPSAPRAPDDPAHAGALAFLEALETTYENGETDGRSEERRVGKECGYQCRSRWSPYH